MWRRSKRGFRGWGGRCKSKGFSFVLITIEALARWLDAPTETEHLEFKEAKFQFDSTRLLKYCVALANERGGCLVLGVTDKRPRNVVGTEAFGSAAELNEIKSRIVAKLRFRVNVTELWYDSRRVLVFEIPSRPVGHPIDFDGAYLMRVGDELLPMTADQLRKIFAETEIDWFERAARADASPDEIVELLDTQAFFDLSNLPYPTNREGVIERLLSERLIVRSAAGWNISNLAAILFAKSLKSFPDDVVRRAPRVVMYDGVGKSTTRHEQIGTRGYAVAFNALLDFVYGAAPQNKVIEQAIRAEVKMFPKQALRELIANALVHQDFSVGGATVMVEMYSDRVEISNPGLPPISLDRFIDEYRYRNDRLADFMRRLGLCEQKGSGIDKVIQAAEQFQLPAPEFQSGELRTTAILYAHREFEAMSKPDRIRACYQHCCLMFVSRQRMSNQSLRQRFGLAEDKAAIASQVIAATKAAELIRADETDSSSTRYARYLPYWA